jgi:hypothetical protein
MTTSPMLQAIDLTRVNIDSMTLEELEDHAKQVLDTIGAMNEYINSPAPKSANAKRNGLRLADKLRSHMAHVRDLINAHIAAVALVGAAQAAGSANLPQGARPLGL